MRLLLLGPFAALHNERPLSLGRRQERLLLAILAVDAGRVVPTERLIDLIWADHPPASARAAIHTYVARLRAALKPTGITIDGRDEGYTVAAGRLYIDALHMDELASQARTADPVSRIDLLGQALALWRGPFLAGMADDHLRHRIGRRFDGLRVQCLRDRAETLLALGRPNHTVLDLASALDDYPADEELNRYYMIALYRTNRRSEALSVYDSLRHRLADDYGIDPSSTLTDLYLRILRSDPSGVGNAPVPNQLPRRTPDFVGREADFTAIDELTGQATSGLVALTAIGGMSGAGKTAIAVEWAYRAADRFPDGIFYLNLRGYDAESPVSPIDALSYFIRALGHPPASVPGDEAGAEALFRTLLAGKCALVILDNARSPEQVRPLLPNSPESVILVTSRDRLTGLIARDGARPHVLGMLTPAESFELLSRLIGPRRAAAERSAAAAAAELVGHLPIAIRVLGARLAANPSVTIESLVDLLRRRRRQKLADRSHRPDPLDVDGDPQSSVRTLFRYSYDRLGPFDRRLFRLLASAPFADLPAAAIARLVGAAEVDTAASLAKLIELSLITVGTGGGGTDRYSLHDLMRDFAREIGSAEDAATETSADRGLAVERVIQWYVMRVRSAAIAMYPSFSRAPGPDAAPLGTSEQAAAFIEAEMNNLLIVIDIAAAAIDPRAAWLIVDALRGYWWTHQQRAAWTSAAHAALEAATRVGDAAGQASAGLVLGTLASRTGRTEEARIRYQRALDVLEDGVWPEGAAALWGNLGIARYDQGYLREALEAHQRALAINRGLARTGTASVNLTNLALVQARLGQVREAAGSLEAAVDGFRSVDDRFALSVAVHNLGTMRQRLGDFDRAASDYLTAIELYRHAANSDGEGLATSSLAALRRDQGRMGEALTLSRTAVRKLAEADEHESLVMARNTLASILSKSDDLDHALRLYLQNTIDARKLGIRRPEAEALIGLGRTRHACGESAGAIEALDQALMIASASEMTVVRADVDLARAEVIASEDQVASRVLANSALATYRAAGDAVGAREAERHLAELGDDPS